MSTYPSKADTNAAFDALRDASEAIDRARQALRTESWAVDQLAEAARGVARARQVASCADDFHKGRLAEKPQVCPPLTRQPTRRQESHEMSMFSKVSDEERWARDRDRDARDARREGDAAAELAARQDAYRLRERVAEREAGS